MSREQVLAGIRAGLTDPAQRQGATSDTLHARWANLHPEPQYQRETTLSRTECIALFAERLREYDAELAKCNSLEDVPQSVAAMLKVRSKHLLVVPPALPAALLPSPQDGFTWLRDDPPLSNEQLNAVDGVVTLATVAVSISGSIALQHGPTEGRRVLTLLPDFHLCILRASQLVETLPEALARLQPTAAQPTTFFSGPSATADIEMTRIKGVHGPRFLAVLLVHA